MRIGQNPQNIGTTSACAENTSKWEWGQYFCRNYLRVRGEYLENLTTGDMLEELPPRARRILKLLTKPKSMTGTTSACAENTPKPTYQG